MILSEINVYPIKSLRGISQTEAKIERRGLEFDRCWMLVDENNKFMSQRDFPKMATLTVKILDNALEISNGAENFAVPFSPPTNETATVEIWTSRVKAKIYEGAANEFFSDALQIKCRLARMPDETRRKVNYIYAVHKDDEVSFADALPFLLIGENSLADLNGKLEKPVPMNRFRPGLVVKDSEAFAEDSWKKIKIGGTVFHIVKPCARCVVTTIEQATGEKRGTEPLKTLADYRIPKRSVKRKILFGQYLIAESAGEILRVGDEVEILETQRKPEFL